MHDFVIFNFAIWICKLSTLLFVRVIIEEFFIELDLVQFKQGGAVLKHVLFQLGDQIYGLSVDHIQSIETLPSIRPVPLAPEQVVGISNLRGQVLTVMDLRRMLSMTNREMTSETRMVVTDGTAFIVDAALDVVEVDDGEIEFFDGHESVRGVWRCAQQLVQILDPHKLD